MVERLKEKEIELQVSKEVEKKIAKEGFDPVYGARPIKRAIQDLILDELSLQIVEGKVKKGDKVEAILKSGEIVFK